MEKFNVQGKEYTSDKLRFYLPVQMEQKHDE